MKAHTSETQGAMTPQLALEALKNGNERFVSNLRANRDLNEQRQDTSTGQFPFATVLSCIDSRVSSELIFDQGIGDIFSVRIAGNQVNEDILGSMEFACKLAGTKLILVLGHTSCGAIKGACDHARMGNLTHLIEKLEPAVDLVKSPEAEDQRTSKNLEFVDEVAAKNVQLGLDRIRKESPILAQMEADQDILILGGMYDIKSGSVTIL
ncbi:carbonic anhydrase family protein [Sediminicola luteus]|uniref:Carbonic anhydrase n=1 Tax=Sediminicola luteus TaxID=319238 RepID=A0A2A4G9D2_9FLAO|nr:carbonic anhydrase family protein [Sediminicola luteus]PCE64365.1 carbonic anhydrase [Sediminicola luteus]